MTTPITINTPDLWLSRFPRHDPDGHKYDRGHCVVVGGCRLTGAARLAAEAATRIGAGLVTVVAADEIANVYRASLPAHIMVENCDGDHPVHLADVRRNALVVGPGITNADAVAAWIAARQNQIMVLDAGALVPESLAHVRADDVITPHAGEYQKLFGEMAAQDVALKIGCVVVLKGAQTTITDGKRLVVNDHAGPNLATAGTGDVLAGMIGGLVAQGMNSFDAACAAVWIHGDAALHFGPGLVASDLPDEIPGVLEVLFAEKA